jgi:hypothetical protein
MTARNHRFRRPALRWAPSFYIAAVSSWLQLCVSRSTGRYNRSRSRLRPSVRTLASGAIALIPACSAARFS